MAKIGVIANPSAGKDIRRLVASGRIISNQEKANIISRFISGLVSKGVRDFYFMPDKSGLCKPAIENYRNQININFLDTKFYDGPEQTLIAASLLNDIKCDCVLVLGGDGTNRLVAKNINKIPLIPISTGTNNAFPLMIDPTIAGIATGFYVNLLGGKKNYLIRNPYINVKVDENEEDIEDPRWELIRKLVEYKRFKDVTVDLQKLEFDQEKVYTRLPGSIPLDPLPMDNRLEASIFDLIGAVDRVLQQYFYREAAKREIVDDQWSISEKIVVIRRRLGEAGQLRFSELFSEACSRGEIVATFLALLELVRLKHLLAMQSEVFGDIDIVRLGDWDDSAIEAFSPELDGEHTEGDDLKQIDN